MSSQPTDKTFHLAVDLGAGSGRVVLGRFGDAELFSREVHRFSHPIVRSAGHLRWDSRHIFSEIKQGVRSACEASRDLGGRIVSLGVDSWGVDYALLDQSGALLEEPVSYRDDRTLGRMEEVFAQVPRREVFDRTGIQFLALNTLYQLFAHVRGDLLPPGTRRFLMIPDLFHYLLGGRPCGEYTNATTTQMVNARTGEWDGGLLGALGLPAAIMPSIVRPGEGLGTLSLSLQSEIDAPPITIIAPATHDTACAVVGTPLEEGWAFLSSGTWSLLGVERTDPLIDDATYRLNFTNEGGAFGTITFLKNIAGLWILESCRRQWQERGVLIEYEALARAMEKLPASPGLINPDDQRFFNPPDMIGEVEASLRDTGQQVPADQVAISRVVLDSLALRCSQVVEHLDSLIGSRVPGIHIVGGGSRNEYLNQAISDACGRPVLAGPVEATSLGSLMVQAIATGRFASLADARAFVKRHLPGRPYTPRARSRWQDLRKQFDLISGTV
jgi:rhamnulokinase